MLPAKRAGVLDLPAADLARGLLQAVEQRRQIGLQQLAPGRGGAQPPARRAGRDAAQNVDAADIEHVLVDRPADPRRVEVGAAGQHGVRLSRRPCQCAQRLFKAAWTKVDTHIVRVRTMPMGIRASQSERGPPGPHLRLRTNMSGPGGPRSDDSDDPGKKLEELALLLVGERLQSLARHRRPIDQQLGDQAMAFGGQAEQRAPRVAGMRDANRRGDVP